MLHLIRGLPGSGKTTMAQALLDKGIIDCFFEADQYFEKDGVYTFVPELVTTAHEWCQEQTFNALRQGLVVAVSNTFSRRWEMEPYLEFCRQEGIPRCICVCEGYWPSIHAPDEVVARMRQRWEP